MLFRLFLFAFFALLSFDYAAAIQCNSQCSGSQPCSSSYISTMSPGYSKTIDLSSASGGNNFPGARACPKVVKVGSTGEHQATISARIGWGRNCEIPSGDNDVSQATCLTTHNLLGKVIDTILTVGIAPTMFNQYCSVSPGDPQLEGGIISNDLLDVCSQLTSSKGHATRFKKKCLSCIFKGLSYNIDENECANTSECKTTACIKYNVGVNKAHILQGSDICQGIPNLDRPVHDSDGRFVTYQAEGESIPTQVYCPLMRCNMPTEYIMSKYYDSVEKRTEIIGGLTAAAAATGGLGAIAGLTLTIISAAEGSCCDVHPIYPNSGDTGVGLFGIVKLKGTTTADRVCAEMLMPDGYTTVGCKFRTPTPVIYPKPACSLSKTACLYHGKSNSKWVMPLTSTLMECVTDITNLFFQPGADIIKNSASGESQESKISCPTNHLFLFQNNLRSIVKWLLILYVVVYGINLAFGGSFNKGEFFSFIFKFAMVAYFSVGTFTIVDDNVGPDATHVSKNGLELVKDLAFSTMSSFSSMVMNSTGGTSCNNGAAGGMYERPCIFNAGDYPDGYQYLALWDAIDCHMSFYLGLTAPTLLGLQHGVQGSGSALDKTGGVGMAMMMLPAFLSFEIVLLIFIVAISIFLFSIIVYFVNLYIVASLAVTILIFFGPMFIPLALFNYTKGLFEKWYKLLFGYALQPVVISAFIALLVTTFHYIFYTGCKFSYISEYGFPFWVVHIPDGSGCGSQSACSNSFGYLLSQMNPAVVYQRTAFADGLWYYTGLVSSWKQMLETLVDSMMLCTFFGFLFYFFAEQLSDFAADLTGSMPLGGVIGPNAVTNLVADKIASKMSGGATDKLKELKKNNRSGVQVSGSGRGSGVQVSGSQPGGRGGVQAFAGGQGGVQPSGGMMGGAPQPGSHPGQRGRVPMGQVVQGRVVGNQGGGAQPGSHPGQGGGVVMGQVVQGSVVGNQGGSAQPGSHPGGGQSAPQGPPVGYQGGGGTAGRPGAQGGAQVPHPGGGQVAQPGSHPGQGGGGTAGRPGAQGGAQVPRGNASSGGSTPRGGTGSGSQV